MAHPVSGWAIRVGAAVVSHPAVTVAATAPGVPVKVVIDSWGADYGTSLQPEAEPEGREPDVTVAIERAPDEWEPIVPDAERAGDVLFIDGVRRIDARTWLVLDDGEDATQGLAASYAAGAVRSRGKNATIEACEARRSIFAAAGGPDLDCGPAMVYPHRAVPVPTPQNLDMAVQDAMRSLERQVAFDVGDADLVVIDGPLSGQRRISRAVGYVKTHQRQYLPEDQRKVVTDLAEGQRTPLFLTRTNYSRYSWYVRLPNVNHVDGHPWAGIIRCEIDPELSAAEAVELADIATATLPVFASQRHRDPRAPQNLVPIGTLEQHLRHRLGDSALLERNLRSAAAALAS